MTGIILDTNVISELVRPCPSDSVLDWFAHTDSRQLATTAVTIAELFSGIRRMPEGQRRRQLAKAIDFALMPLLDHIHPFNATAAIEYAEVRDIRERAGRPIGVQDAMIAAIARSQDAALATRNVRDFEGTGVTLVDPWHRTAGTDR